MPETTSDFDTKKRQWFSQNVVPPPGYGRRRSVSFTSDKSNSLNPRRSISTGSMSKLAIKTKATRSAKDAIETKRGKKTGFTIHFSLARAMKSLRKQEKEIYRPTITPQKMQQLPVVKRPALTKKKNPVHKRFVFDHETKQWKQEITTDNHGSKSTQVLAVTAITSATTAPRFAPNMLPDIKTMSKYSSTSTSGQSRRSSYVGSVKSGFSEDGSVIDDSSLYYGKSSLHSDSNVSTSDLSIAADSSDSESETPPSGPSDKTSRNPTQLSLLDVSGSFNLPTPEKDHVAEDNEGSVAELEAFANSTTRLSNLQLNDNDILEDDVETSLISIQNAFDDEAFNSVTTPSNKYNDMPLRPGSEALAQSSVDRQSRASFLSLPPFEINKQVEYTLVDMDTKQDVGKMKFLTPRGSKVIVKKTKLRKKEPGAISDSEDTENERDDFPGCRYLYQLVHCRALTNPLVLKHNKEKMQSVGVIELFTGHGDSGALPDNHTCPYCVVEPGKVITRWLSGMRSPGATSLYTYKDAHYYCKMDKRNQSRNVKRQELNRSNKLVTIPEV